MINHGHQDSTFVDSISSLRFDWAFNAYMAELVATLTWQCFMCLHCIVYAYPVSMILTVASALILLHRAFATSKLLASDPIHPSPLPIAMNNDSNCCSRIIFAFPSLRIPWSFTDEDGSSPLWGNHRRSQNKFPNARKRDNLRHTFVHPLDLFEAFL
jgi:hypothetical protein